MLLMKETTDHLEKEVIGCLLVLQFAGSKTGGKGMPEGLLLFKFFA
jgi:hypothetical protein